jgi:hypothetical protein
MYWIRYTTATHNGCNGPFRSPRAAWRESHRASERGYYLGRLGVIVAAPDRDAALQDDAEVLACVSEPRPAWAK